MQRTIWEDCPFGTEILLVVKGDDGCSIAYLLPVREKEITRSTSVCLSQISLQPHPAGFLKMLAPPEALDWVNGQVGTCQYRGMENHVTGGACQAQTPLFRLPYYSWTT